jgi:hypothetical protein
MQRFSRDQLIVVLVLAGIILVLTLWRSLMGVN